MGESGDFTGVVAAATLDAAESGAEVLSEGGNAVDAAVAASLVLAVTEPAGSGLGGQHTFIVQRRGEAPVVINGATRAPAGTPPGASVSDLEGHRATTVPTALRVLDLAHRRFGSGRVSWRRLVEPAVAAATEGYELGAFRHRLLLRHVRSIRRSAGASRLLLTPKGAIPQEGSKVRAPTLAATLERIAREGAEEFYTGATAREIAADMAAHGGWVTAADLAEVPEPPVVAPLLGSYRGWDVATLPPPASGWVVLLALNILELAPPEELAKEGAERTRWLTEALDVAHKRRVTSPVADVDDYEASVAIKTSKDKARGILRSLRGDGTGETTHLSVVDRDGTLVGVTGSLNSHFGARAASPELGVLYNDYMREFVVGTDCHPFALRPGGKPASSMSATILSRGGEPALVLGSPGDERIISAVVQVVSHWVDVHEGIRAAVAAPRLHTVGREDLVIEARPSDPDTLFALERLGHIVHQPVSALYMGSLHPYFGGVHAVAFDGGRWRGAADPRRDGRVVEARPRTPSES